MSKAHLNDCKLFQFSVRGDDRGSLVALEGSRDIPFPIARTYYVYGSTADVVRGQHAHHQARQLAVAVSGSCTMLLDDGYNRREVLLDRPDRGIYLAPMVWHEMHHFSAGCVLLVLADAPYEEWDYIRNYDEFLRLARQGPAQ